MPLDIKSSVDAHTARVTLSGELDGNSAPALRETIDQVLRDKPATLILQVEDLTFMASAGLRIIIFAKQKLPTLKIYLIKPNAAIVDTLHKTGFFDGVHVSETEPDGI